MTEKTRFRIKTRAFICCAASNIKEARCIAKSIKTAKHVVTSSWLYDKEERTPEQRYAINNIDILRSDFILVLEYAGLDEQSSVEIGFALANNIRVVLLGEPRCVYHLLPQVSVYKSWSEIRDVMFPMPKYVKKSIQKMIKKRLDTHKRYVQARWKAKQDAMINKLDELEQIKEVS